MPSRPWRSAPGRAGAAPAPPATPTPSPRPRPPSAIIDAATLATVDRRGQGQRPARHRRPRGRDLGRVRRQLHVDHQEAHPGRLQPRLPDELTMTREEGLGPAIEMMLSGPRMDALVQKLGIDAATTIVLTIPRGSTDLEHVPAVGRLLDLPLLGLLARPREDPERRRRRLGRGRTTADRRAPRPHPLDLQRHRQQGPEGRAPHLGRRDAGLRRLRQPGPEHPQHLADARRARLRHAPLHRQRVPRQRRNAVPHRPRERRGRPQPALSGPGDARRAHGLVSGPRRRRPGLPLARARRRS